MSANAIPPRQIGVFMDSLGQAAPDAACAAAAELGFGSVQIGKLPGRFYNAAGAAEIAASLRRHRLKAASVVIIFDGEDYADFRAVEETVGYRPAQFLAERLEYSRRCADFAAALGAPFVTTHMGVLPREESGPVYQRLFDAVSEVARYGASRGVTLALETGQEAAEELLRFLDRIPGRRVGVNFDTANLVLYGRGDSPAALALLLPRVLSAHVKDGLPPARPGVLGVETRLGEGRGRVARCLELFRQARFAGPLIIENFVALSRQTDPLDELRLARDFIMNA